MTQTSSTTRLDRAGEPDRAPQPDRLARWRDGALVVAPLLLVLGSVTHPAEAADSVEQLVVVADSGGRWWVSHVALMLAAGLLLPALGGLADRLGPAAPARTGAARVLTGIGSLGLLALIAAESTATWALSRAGAGVDAAAVLDDVIAAESALFLLPILGLHLGLLLLAPDLRSVPGGGSAGAVALFTGSLVLLAGNATSQVAVTALGATLLAAALVPVGVRGLRDGRSA